MEATDRTRRARFDAFDVDMRSGEVRKHGIRLKLHGQPFQVLSLLLEHPGDVVTREELRQKLWPGDTFVDFDTGLNSAVKKLRDALCDSAEEPRYIETLPRRGYRFIAHVENGDLPAPAPIEERLATVPAVGPRSEPSKKRRFMVAAGVATFLIGAALVTWRVSFAGPALTGSDVILLASFVNKTGDPIFDNSLDKPLEVNALRKEFDLHKDLSLRPDRAYSPVSLAKSYLRDMGVVYPLKKFDVSPNILGSAMEAFYAGRTECKIRRIKTPVVYCDLLSAYPTCNALQRNWDILTAESLTIEDCAQEARELLAKIARDPVEVLLDKSTWPKLRFFAPIKPNGDILPLRAKYDDESQNIGFNYAYGSDCIYYTGFGLAASILLARKVPIIESAFKVVPNGKQAGLRGIHIRGEVPVNPVEDDFYQFVTEERAKVKKTNEPLAEFLKCVGNGGAFGLFAQIDPRVEAQEVIVEVFSGAADPFPSATINTERGGSWYFPILASWITSGAHLLLALWND